MCLERDNSKEGGFSCPYQESKNKARFESNDSSELEKKEKGEELKKLIFYQQTKDHVSFYSPFGDKECTYASDWCKKYCYLKSKPFDKKVNKKIQSTNIRSFGINVLPSIIEQLDATYFTVFSSGCIENLGRNVTKPFYEGMGVYIKKIVRELEKRNDRELTSKRVRFFIRGAAHHRIPNLQYSNTGVIILSIDNSSPKDVLFEAFENEDIQGIAIINHKDNEELISLVKNKIFLHLQGIEKVIDCKDCDDKMLCFNQKKRFILIQNYK